MGENILAYILYHSYLTTLKQQSRAEKFKLGKMVKGLRIVVISMQHSLSTARQRAQKPS